MYYKIAVIIIILMLAGDRASVPRYHIFILCAFYRRTEHDRWIFVAIRLCRDRIRTRDQGDYVKFVSIKSRAVEVCVKYSSGYKVNPFSRNESIHRPFREIGRECRIA